MLGVLAGHPVQRIIARRVARTGAWIVLAVMLSSCAATRWAYNQAPNLSYWWIHNQVDLDDAQSVLARNELDRFFQWHRQNELPAYSDLLRQWQALAPGELTPDQVCAQFAEVRRRLEHAADQTVAPLARLALKLSPAQLASLQRHQERGNEDFEKNFLRGSPEQRLKKRLDAAVGRIERIYGTLDNAQRQRLLELLRASPFDPQRTQAERLRRQADLLQTVRDAQAAPTRAEALVRAHHARIARSPTPGYDAYSRELQRQTCTLFAALHNTTTSGQRANAVRVFSSYENDFQVLIAER